MFSISSFKVLNDCRNAIAAQLSPAIAAATAKSFRYVLIFSHEILEEIR